jgi:hypothetical protein
MNLINLPEASRDLCRSCEHPRRTHYEGPLEQCNARQCLCEAFGGEEVTGLTYFMPPVEPLEFYVEKLKALTKEYPKDHQGNGLRYGGYHFVVGDTLAIESEFGERLMEEIASFKPKDVVELGTGRGYSTCWIMLGLLKSGGGKLTTFDTEIRNFHVNHMDFPGQFKMYKKEFKNVNKELPKKIDFVFHDSAHKFELIVPDLEILLPRMSSQGRIWFHDAYDHVSIPLQEYFDQKGWDYTWIKESSHLGFAKKK